MSSLTHSSATSQRVDVYPLVGRVILTLPVRTTAHLLHSFLESTSTQLTYPGLVSLCQSPTLLPPSGLAALFRNSHLSVLYRRPSLPPPPAILPPNDKHTTATAAALPDPELFTLVTDSSLGQEGEIVWESLGDVDGGGSEFFDAALRRAQVRGGDWVGYRGSVRHQGDGRSGDRIPAEAGHEYVATTKLQESPEPSVPPS